MQEGNSWGCRSAALKFCCLMLAVAASVAIVACRRHAAEPKISVQEQITPQPVKTGLASLSIILTDEAAQAIAHATIQVEGDMSHPGMSPVFSQATEVEPGKYQAPINFTMGGDWAVLLHIRLPDGRKVERQINVPNVQTTGVEAN
jgi:hypothetical protein